MINPINKQSIKPSQQTINKTQFPSVLCTAPRKYHVIESEGLIKSHCRIDVVIRHKEPLEESTLDKFQIQLFDHGSSTVRGHKQVISHVLPGKPTVTIRLTLSVGGFVSTFFPRWRCDFKRYRQLWL